MSARENFRKALEGSISFEELPPMEQKPDFLVGEDLCVFLLDEACQPAEKAQVEQKKWSCIERGYKAVILWYSMCDNEVETYQYISHLIEQPNLYFSPGDLADRMTIMMLKHGRIGASPQLTFDFYQITFLWTETIRLFFQDTEKMEKLMCLFDELYDLNALQWDHEVRVRTEESWEAAQDARNNNAKRVECKNEINRLFNYPIEEKKYRKNEV